MKQSFDFCRSFIGREETREMGLDLKELKELTASFKNASVRRNVNEDQVKPVVVNQALLLSYANLSFCEGKSLCRLER